MERSEAVSYLKGCIEDYLRRKGLPTDGKTLFTCLSPGHPDKHPSMCYYKEGKMVRCFGCHAKFDIFDLIGMDYGLSGFNDQLQKAAELYGIEIGPSSFTGSKSKVCTVGRKDDQMVTTDKNNAVYSVSPNVKPEVFAKNVAFMENSGSNRNKAVAYLESRGISGKFADRFHIGFSMYHDYGSNSDWNVLVLPNPNGPIGVVRNTSSCADKSNRYRKLNGSGMWNTDCLKTGADNAIRVVITEGELDALSVMTCGGLAVALSSTSNVSRVVPVLQQMFGPDPAKAPELVLSLDNDEEGRKAAKDLSLLLKDANYHFAEINLAGSYKDPNEALMKDAACFKERVLASRTSAEWELYEFDLKYNDEKYIPNFLNEILSDKSEDTVSTGFDRLDAVLEGGIHPDLYAIGAIPSLGKTTFILQMAYNIAKAGRDVFYFSLEMSRSELVAKHISRLTFEKSPEDGLGSFAAKTTFGVLLGSRYKKYAPEELDIIQESIADYASVSRHIYTFEGVGNFGVKEIEKIVADRIRTTGRVPVVFIDYLQILAPYDDRLSDKSNMDKSVIELKRLSREKKVPVICISSFNRDNYSVAASFKAFKESGIIESTVAVCLALQLKGVGDMHFDVEEAKSKKPREVELVVLKNRFGETGKKILYFYHQMFNMFEEATSNDASYEGDLYYKLNEGKPEKPLRKL